jgi:hypothetical protein
MPASIRWAELTDFEALKRSRLNRLRGATKKPSNPSDCHALVELAGRRARCDEGHNDLLGRTKSSPDRERGTNGLSVEVSFAGSNQTERNDPEGVAPRRGVKV